jgi:hypothetical protein
VRDREFHWPNDRERLHVGTDVKCDRVLCFREHEYAISCMCGFATEPGSSGYVHGQMIGHYLELCRQLRKVADGD